MMNVLVTISQKCIDFLFFLIECFNNPDNDCNKSGVESKMGIVLLQEFVSEKCIKTLFLSTNNVYYADLYIS